MPKALTVAVREFSSTVLTRGFIIGVLMTPLLVLMIAGLFMLIGNLPEPRVVGTVGLVDRSGLAADLVVERYTPAALEARAQRIAQEAQRLANEGAQRLGVDPAAAGPAQGMIGQAVAQRVQGGADLSVEVLPPDTDVEKLKAELAGVDVHAAGRRDAGADSAAAPKPRVALAVIPESLQRAPSPPSDAAGESAEGGSDFDLFVAPKLDFEVQRDIQRNIAAAIVDARLANDPRLKAAGLDAASVRALIRQPETRAVTVTESGERRTSNAAAVFLPMGLMILLLGSVMTAGQYLLTTTIEEKGSRVMEVLLSAVSPMQLMVGKILGQMAVGLLILVVYSGMGIAALIYFSLGHLLDPMNLVYALIFFFIAFFLIASMMAGIGSAVTELREAQTLMTPVMVIMMVPWVLWLPISRAPNSTFATVLSFVPGINPFTMMIRLAGSEPVPFWQVPVSILVGVASAVFMAWAAAKVFRVGVLMYGKPPDFKTLVRWVRMA